jgi:hypothetical protein
VTEKEQATSRPAEIRMALDRLLLPDQPNAVQWPVEDSRGGIGWLQLAQAERRALHASLETAALAVMCDPPRDGVIRIAVLRSICDLDIRLRMREDYAQAEFLPRKRRR